MVLMARSLHLYFSKSYSLVACVASVTHKIVLRSEYSREFFPQYNVKQFQVSNICNYYCPSLQCFCTSSKQESTDVVLLRKLEIALNGHKVNEAWEAYTDFKSLYGFPQNSLMSKLITELSYSSDSNWLRRAGELVISLKEKNDLLRPDLLMKLSLSLSRARMPVPASMILRLMLEKDTLPPVDILNLVVLHMVKTDIGTCLASNILVEICECFQDLSANKLTHANLVKPNTMIFNLVLDGCVRFRSSFKGQRIIELMAQVGVIADGHTINIVARIHEMNFQRDELKRFKDHIDQVSAALVRHYRQFYDSLLNLHFRFDDIDSTCALILDMYGHRGSPNIQEARREPQKPCFAPVRSQNLRGGLKLQICPQLLQKDSVLKGEGGKGELIIYKNGKLILSNKALAKLIVRLKRSGRISELSNLLIIIQTKLGPFKAQGLCSDVIDACIHLGWLGTAHDILEDFESAGVPLAPGSYTLLLSAYHRGKMFREAEALLKQIQNAGLALKDGFSSVEATTISKSDLAECLVREMSEKEKVVPFVVNELNSSIYFFMMAKMVGDAVKTYRRMVEKNILPNVSTFFALIYGYSSLEMYREITILWGDIKRNNENGNLIVNRDLYELLVLNFLRGGYFERVMEVIGRMKDHGMFADKWMYKREFLKFHKDLYRNLKASKAKDEVQSNRIEHVRAFRKWVGIH
ncbi:hypothetical protein LguiA_017664 [Lonicera macranthoides]